MAQAAGSPPGTHQYTSARERMQGESWGGGGSGRGRKENFQPCFRPFSRISVVLSQSPWGRGALCLKLVGRKQENLPHPPQKPHPRGSIPRLGTDGGQAALLPVFPGSVGVPQPGLPGAVQTGFWGDVGIGGGRVAASGRWGGVRGGRGNPSLNPRPPKNPIPGDRVSVFPCIYSPRARVRVPWCRFGGCPDAG